MWEEERIRLIASDQHGVVTRRDLLAMGATSHQIQNRVRCGRLTKLQAGVYYVNATPPTWKSTLLAAVFAAGPGAAASHRSAGRLWELDGVIGKVIEVTVPYDDRPEPPGVLLHRTRREVPRETRNQIPATTVERTLLDLAAILPRPALEKSIAAAVRRSLTTLSLLDQTIARYGGRGVKGTRKFRQTLGVVAGDQSGSPSEVEVAALIRKAPIPSPVQQLRIRLSSGRNAYPDFAWPDRMKIVEVDGFGAHSTPDQLSHDLGRQNDLMELGWEVRRYSARDVRRDPHRVIHEITAFVGP